MSKKIILIAFFVIICIGSTPTFANYYTGAAPTCQHGGSANDPNCTQVNDSSAPNVSAITWKIDFDGSGELYGGTNYQDAVFFGQFGLPALNRSDIVWVSGNYKTTANYSASYGVNGLMTPAWETAAYNQMDFLVTDGDWHRFKAPLVVGRDTVDANAYVKILDVGYVNNTCSIEVNDLNITVERSSLIANASTINKKMVCFGDSLTKGTANVPYPTTLGLMFPVATIINNGVVGDTTEQLVARYKTSVTDLNPDIVIIEAGGNDILQGRSITEAEANLQKMYSWTIANGSIPVAVTVLPLDGYKTEVSTLNTWIVTNAINMNIPYCNIYSVLNDPATPGSIIDFYDALDNLHPNDPGYTVVALAIAHSNMFNGTFAQTTTTISGIDVLTNVSENTSNIEITTQHTSSLLYNTVSQIVNSGYVLGSLLALCLGGIGVIRYLGFW